MRKRIFISILGIIFVLLLFVPVFSQGMNDYFTKANYMLISGNLNEAVSYYNLAIQQNPRSPEAYLGLGMAYKELGRYQEAYLATSTAIKLKPQYFQAYYNLGLILEKQNKCEDAIKAYDKFLKEVPAADRFSDAKQKILQLKKGC